MSKVSSLIVIEKLIEEVFDYTASPVNGPSFIPNLNENTNIKPEKPGLGQTFDWHFNLIGVDLKGKAEVIEFDRPKKATIKTWGSTNSIWRYLFEKENGNTKITVEVDYEIPENILGKLMDKLIIEKINQKSARQMLENLKDILEAK